MSTPTSHLASSASSAPPASRRRRRWRAALVTALAVLLPLGGATAWALDRFVVEHVEIDDVSAYEASQGLDAGGASGQGATADDGAGASTGTSAATSAGTGTVDGDTYTSDATSITVSRVTTGSGDDTLTYYVADVVLSDMTDLRSAFA